MHRERLRGRPVDRVHEPGPDQTRRGRHAVVVAVGNRRRRGFDGAARLLDDELWVDRRGWRNRGRIEAGPRPGQGKVEVASEGDALRQAARVIAGREDWFRQCGADEDRVEAGRAFGVAEQGSLASTALVRASTTSSASCPGSSAALITEMPCTIAMVMAASTMATTAANAARPETACMNGDTLASDDDPAFRGPLGDDRRGWHADQERRWERGERDRRGGGQARADGDGELLARPLELIGVQEWSGGRRLSPLDELVVARCRRRTAQEVGAGREAGLMGAALVIALVRRRRRIHAVSAGDRVVVGGRRLREEVAQFSLAGPAPQKRREVRAIEASPLDVLERR